mmetsp:Transcript_6935/g.19479  ORF Transcript_6935/g.19479 Transcript_6935/m.19479 type:complete len:208 (+) Transcript_6935:502-1125(+)
MHLVLPLVAEVKHHRRFRAGQRDGRAVLLVVCDVHLHWRPWTGRGDDRTRAHAVRRARRRRRWLRRGLWVRTDLLPRLLLQGQHSLFVGAVHVLLRVLAVAGRLRVVSDVNHVREAYMAPFLGARNGGLLVRQVGLLPPGARLPLDRRHVGREGDVELVLRFSDIRLVILRRCGLRKAAEVEAELCPGRSAAGPVGRLARGGPGPCR